MRDDNFQQRSKFEEGIKMNSNEDKSSKINLQKEAPNSSKPGKFSSPRRIQEIRSNNNETK